MQRAGEEAGPLRHHQADEADDAGDRDEERGRDAGRHEGGEPRPADPHAEAFGSVLAGRQRVEAPVVGLGEGEGRQGVVTTRAVQGPEPSRR